MRKLSQGGGYIEKNDVKQKKREAKKTQVMAGKKGSRKGNGV